MGDNVAVSQDRNVIKKETEKIIKYEDITIEIQHMWNAQTKVIPVITGATDHHKIIQKIPRQHIGKAQNKKMQTTATMGTAHTFNLSNQLFIHYKIKTITTHFPPYMFQHSQGAIIRQSLC
jgi:hypothetical protein